MTRTTTRWATLLGVAALLAAAGCDDSKLERLLEAPDTSPMRRALKLSMPLAYAANLSLAAIEGADLPNVHFLTTGAPGAGPFLLEITVDEGFPLPEGIQATGVIVVAGVVTRDGVSGHPDFLLLTVVFSRLDVTAGGFEVQDVTAVPVVVDVDPRTGERRLYVVYANVDVDTGAGPAPLLSLDLDQGQLGERFTRYQDMRRFDGTAATVVRQDTWILTVDDHDTPGDPSDDTYWVGGAEQYVEAEDASGDLMQAILLLAMEPECKRNPREGGGLIQNLGASGGTSVELGHVVLGASGGCDGEIDVLVGTGSYFALTGRSIDLHLED